MEIHPSLILGVMGNQVVFPENNQLPRDLFACGQMRQAVSLYHSNYQTRIDKMGVVLNNGQIPLVKSRYLKKINNEQHPYGENVIVAIMCYGGYNVEDSILFNEGSVKRGLFRTTYYNSYEAREESSKVGNSNIDTHFANIEDENVVGLKPGFDYSDLDKYGLIKENTILNDKKVLIGKVTTNLENPDVSSDASVFPKKGQLGYVDKSFITEGEEGFRLAKIRVRDERVPAIGDKFCSRCGQKGTIGLVIPEEDMPFTEEGIRPDIIINPHALPSRMTIGQLVETLMGKACAMYGGFGDCTAFMNKGQKTEQFGKMLTNVGFHSSGNQLLYNGQSGEQMYSQIFIGPTYYMRLKHMVKDKINYRARGPRTVLTRQTVQGRANDGGLRIGEMERDGIIAHGASKFLQESMLVRGDEYFMAVCNKTGMIAIYNDSYNLFLSPYADGPIRFTGTLSDGLNIQNVSKYGRSFSILRVPYSFKLLIQELQTMNVQMRLITEDNIDQLSSMSFSNNIIKLAGLDATPKSIANENKEARGNIKRNIIQAPRVDIARKEQEKQDYKAVPPPADYASQSPEGPRTPEGAPPPIMPYAPQSPEYIPQSPEYIPQSPPYAPQSPEYIPQSSSEPGTPSGSPSRIAPYAPQSPEYIPQSSSEPGTPSGSPPRIAPYAPQSPEYIPQSPSGPPQGFNAESPVYNPPSSPDYEPYPGYNQGASPLFIPPNQNSMQDDEGNIVISSKIIKPVNEEKTILTEISNENEPKNTDIDNSNDKKIINI